MAKKARLPTYISFISEINKTTSEALLSVVAQQIQEGAKEIHLLISSPGGSTTDGITVFNVLRSLPVKLITHNTGSVNSIANVIYLAGERRYACKTSSFMFHGVGFEISQADRLEEKNLIERLDNLRNDQGLIEQIINKRAHIGAEKVKSLFLQAAFISAPEAKKFGIVHQIRDAKVPDGAPFLQLVFKR